MKIFSRRFSTLVAVLISGLMISGPVLAAQRGGGGGGGGRGGGGGGGRVGGGGGGGGRAGGGGGMSRGGMSSGFSGGGGRVGGGGMSRGGGIPGGFSGGGNRGGISAGGNRSGISGGGISRGGMSAPAVRSRPSGISGGGITAPAVGNQAPSLTTRAGGSARNNPLTSSGSSGAANVGRRSLPNSGANAAVRSAIGGNRGGTVGANALGNAAVTTTRRPGVSGNGRGNVASASFVRNNFGTAANLGQGTNARSLSGSPRANLANTNFSSHNHLGHNHGWHNDGHHHHHHNHWGHFHGGGYYPYRYGYGYNYFPWLPLLGLGWGHGWGGYGLGFGYGYPYGYGGYSDYGYGYSPVTTYSDYSTAPLVADPTIVQSVDPSIAAADAAPAETLDFAGQAEVNFKAGKYPEAVRDFRHALVDDPNNGAYVMLLGQALFASGQFDVAAGATQQATTMLPQDKWGTVVVNYRDLYANIGDYTTQLRALEKARNEKPDDPALRFLLGWHYGYLGYPTQAVRELDKTLELAPKDEVAKKVRSAMAEKLPKSDRPPTPPPPKPEPPFGTGTET